MKCRCKDISNCRNDITNLEQLISINNLSRITNEDISELLENLSMKCELAFTSSNTGELKSGIKQVNIKNSDYINRLNNKFTRGIKILESELVSLKIEDKDYHNKMLESLKLNAIQS